MTPEQTALDDLAYLRSLAEAGRDAPLSAGPYLIAGGSWFGVASLALGIVDVTGVANAREHLWMLFLLSAVGFSAQLAVLIRRDHGRAESQSNFAINATWSAAGWGIFVFWAAAAIVAWRHGSGFFMNAIPLVVLAVYGIGWWVAAAVSRQAWMKGLVAASYLSMLVVGAAIGTPYVWLAYALALFACAVLPGLKLTRLAREVGGLPPGAKHE